MTYARPFVPLAPVRVDMAAPWRSAIGEIVENIYFINQHRRTLERGTDKPEYLAHCRDRLAEHLAAYRRNLRTVFETELAMTLAGHAFNRGN